MSFAAWTKGTSALLLAINALADMEGVGDDLRAEWATSMPELIARSERLPAGVGPKAWRFEGEMHQIADSFAAVGLHDGFHRAAADTYGRLAELKSTDEPTLEDVLRLLGQTGRRRHHVVSKLIQKTWPPPTRRRTRPAGPAETLL
jgi:hypothetical protein